MADAFTISAQMRDRAGKGAARAVRRMGMIPSVVYGENKAPISIAVPPRAVQKGLEDGIFFNSVYTIEIEGGSSERVLPRDVQFHPVSDAALHVDFLRVGRRTRVNVAVPVNFINEDASEGLSMGGTLAVIRHEVELSCRADEIPSELTVDLSGLAIGDAIRMSSIELADGITPVITDRDFMIANIEAPKVASETEEEEGDEEEAATEEAAEAQEESE